MGALKATLSQPRVATAWVAVLVFGLFAIVILWLHDAAAVGTGALGMSVWTESGPTEARLTPVVDAVLHKNAVAGWLAKVLDPSRLDAGSSSDDPPKIWETASDLAEALTQSDARARLATRWTQEMQAPERLASLRKLTGEYFRARRQPSEGKVAHSHLERLVNEYHAALGAVADQWVSDELPPSAIVGILQDKGLTIKTGAGSATGATRRGARDRGALPPSPDPVIVFLNDVQRSATGYLASSGIRDRIHASWQRDLSFESAQKPLTAAIDRDYSGRWMWVIAAAIFVTAALWAVIGAIGRLVMFAGPEGWIARVVVCVLFVVAGGVGGWINLGPVPPFLTEPLRHFDAFYQVKIYWASSLMKSVTLAAIGALIVSSWSSFLVPTRSDEHLEKQLELLRWVFHTATFVLVAGVLHVYAFYQWPSSFLGESAAEAVQSGARVFSLALGAAFSTLLLLIYIPGSSVLVGEARARQAEARASDPQPPEGEEDDKRGPGAKRAERIENMLKEYGFDAAPVQTIVRFAQLFAPLLIAPLGAEIVQLLGS